MVPQAEHRPTVAEFPDHNRGERNRHRAPWPKGGLQGLQDKEKGQLPPKRQFTHFSIPKGPDSHHPDRTALPQPPLGRPRPRARMLRFSHRHRDAGMLQREPMVFPERSPCPLSHLAITSAAALDGQGRMLGWRDGEMEGMERWKDGPQPISRALAKARQRAGRCPYPTLRTTTLLLPVWGNGGVDGGQEAPAARQGGSAARIADITDIATSASGAAPRGFPREGSSARGGTWTSSRASRLHPSPSPQNSPASSRLCTSLHHWLQCQALLGFIFESEAREVPFGGKRKKSIFQPQRAESQVPAPKYLREERRAAASGSGLLQDSFSSVYLENISALRSHPARRSPARPPSA